MDNNQFLQPGATLWNNTYRIEKFLGHGGFGITYLAMDTHLEKRVAIKEFFIGGLCSRDSDSFTVIPTRSNSSDLIEKYKKKVSEGGTESCQADEISFIESMIKPM